MMFLCLSTMAIIIAGRKQPNRRPNSGGNNRPNNNRPNNNRPNNNKPNNNNRPNSNPNNKPNNNRPNVGQQGTQQTEEQKVLSKLGMSKKPVQDVLDKLTCLAESLRESLEQCGRKILDIEKNSFI